MSAITEGVTTRLHRSAQAAALSVQRIVDPERACRRKWPDFAVSARPVSVACIRGNVAMITVAASWVADGAREVLQHLLLADTPAAIVAETRTDICRAALFNDYMRPSR